MRISKMLVPSGKGRKRVEVPAAFEALERRRLFCAPGLAESHPAIAARDAAMLEAGAHHTGAHYAGAPVGYFGSPIDVLTSAEGAFTAAATPNAPLPGLPALHSLPGAPTAIYFDFNGFGSNAPYDEDGNPTAFSTAEAENITEAWRQMSAYFAPFNTDVTTVAPSVPFAWSLSSNSIVGGYSYVGVFPNTTAQSFNQSSDARTRVSGVAHEVGHNFGLDHQSDWDLLGAKVNEYSSGADATHGPLMGVDFARAVHKWSIGHPTSSPSTLQDDVAIIASRIAQQPGGGDGFRPDDYAGAITGAATLAAAGGLQTASGVIERLADADAFSFTAAGGRMNLAVDPVAPSGLAPKVEVYNASGALLAARDDTDLRDGSNNNLSLPLRLEPGTYYAIVKSHGDYADIGQYTITASELPDGWSAAYIGNPSRSGYARHDGGSGVFTLAGSGADIWNTSDGAEYAYTTLSGDGTIIARVASMQNTDPYAKVGLDIRESLAGGARHAGVVATSANGPQFVWRGTAGGNSNAYGSPPGAFAPVYLRLVRSGNSITGSRSADGISWTTVGQATVVMGTDVLVGLIDTAHNTSLVNVATIDQVTTSGGVNPVILPTASPAPTDLAASLGAGTDVALSWTASPAVTGYVIERSLDGTDFIRIGAADAGATSYTDAGIFGSMRYVYRVRASSAAGVSAPTAPVAVVNRPSAPAGLAVTSWKADRVILNWRDVSGETGYRIEQSSDGGAFAPVATVGANVPSYTVSGLAAGTEYAFRLIATSAADDSPPAGAEGSTRLPAVTGLAFKAITGSAISLRWDAAPGATGYRVDRSTDGAAYTPVASLDAEARAYTDAAITPLGEYYYRVVGTNGVTESVAPTPILAAVPAAALPPPPWQSRDFDNTAGVGTTGFDSGSFTMVAAGTDIWNTADQGRMTYVSLVGDGTITARVSGVENTHPYAKAGVMIRETLAANSRFAFAAVTGASGGQFLYRTATGASAGSSSTGGIAAPYWMRLSRAGNVFTASASPDGSTWTQIGVRSISMASSTFIGLALSSHDAGVLNTSTFDNVTVATAAPTYGAFTIGDGGAQRSMVKKLSFTFDRPVTSADAGAFALTRRTDSDPVAVPVTVAIAADGFSVELTFTGAGFIGGSLSDGIYDLIVHPALIHDLAGQSAAGVDQNYTFHRLFSDADGDGDSDNNDLFQMRGSYLKSTGDPAYKSYFDYAANGIVDNADIFQVRSRRSIEFKGY